MDKPAASSLTCPPRPYRSATRARHDDLVVTRQARDRRVWLTHSWPHAAFAITSSPHFSPFCVGAPRRRCILRRWRATVTHSAAHAPPTRARIHVTSPPRLCKGAAADRGSNAVGLPSETVGEGNMPFLMSSLDGEKFFTERAIRPIRVCLFQSNGRGPVDLSPSDLVPRGLPHGFQAFVGFPANRKWRMAWIVIRKLRSFPR